MTTNNIHAYSENGFYEYTEEGTRLVGETCSKCGCERVVVYTVDGQQYDEWLHKVLEMHDLNLPAPDCPPSSEWKATAAVVQQAIEGFEYVQSARALMRKQVNDYKELRKAARRLCASLTSEEIPETEEYDDDDAPISWEGVA